MPADTKKPSVRPKGAGGPVAKGTALTTKPAPTTKPTATTTAGKTTTAATKKKGRADGRPTVCWGCCECVARVSTAIFGIVLLVFHLTCFIVTITFKYETYKIVTAEAGHKGAAEADAAFEFLVTVPLLVVMYGIYDNRKPYSRIVILCALIFTLVFAVILNVVHVFDLMSVANVMNEKHYDAGEDYVLPLLFCYIILKFLACLVLYFYLASSTFKHWMFLGKLHGDKAALDKRVQQAGARKPPA